MKDIHCEDCGRFLLKIEIGVLEIKCPNSKCKHVNSVKILSHRMLSLLTQAEEIAIIKT